MKLSYEVIGLTIGEVQVIGNPGGCEQKKRPNTSQPSRFSVWFVARVLCFLIFWHCSQQEWCLLTRGSQYTSVVSGGGTNRYPTPAEAPVSAFGVRRTRRGTGAGSALLPTCQSSTIGPVKAAQNNNHETICRSKGCSLNSPQKRICFHRLCMSFSPQQPDSFQ